ELPRLELLRRKRRLEHDFDDGRREALHFVHRRKEIAAQLCEDFRRLTWIGRRPLRKHAAYYRETLLGRAERLHHVAEEGGVQVAEVRHEAAIRLARQQHVGTRGFGNRVLRLERFAFFVASLEVFAVE